MFTCESCYFSQVQRLLHTTRAWVQRGFVTGCAKLASVATINNHGNSNQRQPKISGWLLRNRRCYDILLVGMILSSVFMSTAAFQHSHRIPQRGRRRLGTSQDGHDPDISHENGESLCRKLYDFTVELRHKIELDMIHARQHYFWTMSDELLSKYPDQYSQLGKIIGNQKKAFEEGLNSEKDTHERLQKAYNNVDEMEVELRVHAQFSKACVRKQNRLNKKLETMLKYLEEATQPGYKIEATDAEMFNKIQNSIRKGIKNVLDEWEDAANRENLLQRINTTVEFVNDWIQSQPEDVQLDEKTKALIEKLKQVKNNFEYVKSLRDRKTEGALKERKQLEERQAHKESSLERLDKWETLRTMQDAHERQWREYTELYEVYNEADERIRKEYAREKQNHDLLDKLNSELNNMEAKLSEAKSKSDRMESELEEYKRNVMSWT